MLFLYVTGVGGEVPYKMAEVAKLQMSGFSERAPVHVAGCPIYFVFICQIVHSKCSAHMKDFPQSVLNITKKS